MEPSALWHSHPMVNGWFRKWTNCSDLGFKKLINLRIFAGQYGGTRTVAVAQIIEPLVSVPMMKKSKFMMGEALKCGSSAIMWGGYLLLRFPDGTLAAHRGWRCSSMASQKWQNDTKILAPFKVMALVNKWSILTQVVKSSVLPRGTGSC